MSDPQDQEKAEKDHSAGLIGQTIPDMDGTEPRLNKSIRNILLDYAADLRSVTWLAPVSASEMNTRDRWLADQLEAIAEMGYGHPAPSLSVKQARDGLLRVVNDAVLTREHPRGGADLWAAIDAIIAAVRDEARAEYLKVGMSKLLLGAR